MPSFAEALAARRERWLLPPACLLCEAPVPVRQGDALVCELCRSRWEPVTGSAVPALRPTRLRRSGLPALRRVARRARAGAERGLARRLGPRSGPPAQVRRLVAGRGRARRGHARPGAIDRAGMLDTGAARGHGGCGSAATIRASASPRRSGCAPVVPVREDRLEPRAARPGPRRAHAGGSAGQRGRRIRGARRRGLACVLVDDVFTTGATLAAAAAALLRGAGAARVEAVTFARAEPPGDAGRHRTRTQRRRRRWQFAWASTGSAASAATWSGPRRRWASRTSTSWR